MSYSYHAAVIVSIYITVWYSFEWMARSNEKAFEWEEASRAAEVEGPVKSRGDGGIPRHCAPRNDGLREWERR